MPLMPDVFAPDSSAPAPGVVIGGGTPEPA